MWKAVVIVVGLCGVAVVRCQRPTDGNLTFPGTVRDSDTTITTLLETTSTPTSVTVGHDVPSTPVVEGTTSTDHQPTSQDGQSETVHHFTTVLPVETTAREVERSTTTTTIISTGRDDVTASSSSIPSTEQGTSETAPPTLLATEEAALPYHPVDLENDLQGTPEATTTPSSDSPMGSSTTMLGDLMTMTGTTESKVPEDVTEGVSSITMGQMDATTGKGMEEMDEKAEVTTVTVTVSDATAGVSPTTTAQSSTTSKKEVDNEGTTVTEMPGPRDQGTTPTEGSDILVPKTREEKQMDLDPTAAECSCEHLPPQFDASMCPGRRVIPEPDCHCQMTCARQANEACSPRSPCDVEFGLHCDMDTQLCTGPFEARVLDASSTSVHLGWRPAEGPVRVSFSAMYSGNTETSWTEVEAMKSSAVVGNLRPNTEYFVKLEQNDLREIILVKTADHPASSLPRVLVTQRSPTSLTIAWDDFKMANSQAGYIVEYRMADGLSSQHQDTWRPVQASSLPMMTLSHLKPHTPYEIRVAVWEDDDTRKPWQMSEVVTAYTEDGCVWGNSSYLVGQQFFEGCDLTCVCKGDDTSDCRDRCLPPYYASGTKRADPTCYEVPSPEDPSCCVTLRCTEEEEEDVKANIQEVTMTTPKEEGANSSTGDVLSTTGGDEAATTPEVISTTEETDLVVTADGNATEVLPESIASTLPPKTVADQQQMMVPASTTMTSPETIMPEIQSQDMFGDTANESTTTMPPAVTEQPILQTGDPSTTESEVKATTSEVKEMEETTTNPPSYTKYTTTTQSADLMTEFVAVATDEVLKENVSEVMVSTGMATTSTEGADTVTNTVSTEVPMTISEIATTTPAVTEITSTVPPTEATPRFSGCEYSGITYKKGERFEDGCESICICYGSGHVSCLPRCPVMEVAKGSCKEVPDPEDACCFIMDCDVTANEANLDIAALPVKIEAAEAQNATVVRVRTMLLAMPNETTVMESPLQIWYAEAINESASGAIEWQKKTLDVHDLNMTETNYVDIDLDGLSANTDYYVKIGVLRKAGRTPKQGDGSPLIFSNTVNVRTFPAVVQTVFRGCFRHNHSYDAGEVFYEGCEHKCVCREGGLVECQERCDVYIDTVGYEGCEWRPSEVDSCCIVPYCDNREEEEDEEERYPIGPPDIFCVTEHGETRRLGEMWEAQPGCRRRVCKCEMLRNGSTAVRCTGGCPAMPPNAHLPSPECPRPEMVIPDDPCLCPYVVCTRTPSHVMVPVPMCHYKGRQIEIGKEFYDGCRAVCHCGQDLRVSCATVECPYHFDARHSECLEWDVDPTFIPAPPHCCAPAVCKNDGSCTFQGILFKNYQAIPAKLLDCGTQCDCVNGNVTCENLCPPVGDVPPPNLPCPPNMVHKGHAPGDSCCIRWMCREAEKRGQELHNVNIIPVNSTTVRVRFSLPSILVGLIGHAELHFTSDPTLPAREWHLQKFSRPNRVFDSPNIEYYLDGLRPDTSYFMQIKTIIDTLHGGPESELYKLRMPPATTVPPTTTTTLPPLMTVDPMTHVEPVDANSVRVAWRAFDAKEKQLIYGVQLKYKKTTQADDKWVTTPMIHRDVTSYVLHNLDAASSYNVDLLFVAPEGMTTRLESVKAAEVRTSDLPKDEYDFQVSLRQNSVGPYSSEMSLEGIPEPVSKYVNVVKVLYRSDMSGGHAHIFKVPKTDRILLDHLKANKKYKVRLELYLTNGKTLTTNEVEFQTKSAPPDDNTIEPVPSKGKLVEAMASPLREAENKAYFVALIVVAVVAAVAAFGFVLLLILLVRRQASAKAPISRTPSNSAYDNPSYKTYDGEKLDDKTVPPVTPEP